MAVELADKYREIPTLWTISEALHKSDEVVSDLLNYIDTLIARGKTISDVNAALLKENEKLLIELRKYETN